MIAGDTDWVEDVRRWYFNGGRPTAAGVNHSPAAAPKVGKSGDPVDLGYESATPSVLARRWPPTSPGDLRDCL